MDQRFADSAVASGETVTVAPAAAKGVALLPRLALPPIDYCVTADKATAAVEAIVLANSLSEVTGLAV